MPFPRTINLHPEAKPQDLALDFDGKPEAYGTVRRQSRVWGTKRGDRTWLIATAWAEVAVETDQKAASHPSRQTSP